MTQPEVTPNRFEFEPTSTQQDRANTLRRFNVLYVYAPVVLLSLLSLIIVAFLLYISLFPPTDGTLLMISGIADAVVILGTVPAIIICGLIPALVIVALAQTKQRGMAPIKRLQQLFWRIESGIVLVGQKVDVGGQKITRPFIDVRATFAYIRTILHQIFKVRRRS